MGTTVPAWVLMLPAMAALLTVSIARQSQAPATNTASAASQDQPKKSEAASAKARRRKILCKTVENASLCYWTHGRLAVYNGNPSARIWKIGTRRLLGVYNGPSHFPPRSISDDESPELPPNLERAYEIDYRHWKQSDAQYYEYPIIFAGFKVCPLEPAKEGWMQAVCIESAKNLFIEKGWR